MTKEELREKFKEYRRLISHKSDACEKQDFEKAAKYREAMDAIEQEIIEAIESTTKGGA